MKKFKSYYLLLISALCLFVLSTFVKKDSRYTFNISDTYYVISGPDFYKCFAILTLTLGLIYFVLDQSEVVLKKIFTKVHIIATLLLIATLIFFNYKNNVSQTIIIGSTITSQINYGSYVSFNLMLIIFLQFFFLINIFTAQIKNLKNTVIK